MTGAVGLREVGALRRELAEAEARCGQLRGECMRLEREAAAWRDQALALRAKYGTPQRRRGYVGAGGRRG